MFCASAFDVLKKERKIPPQLSSNNFVVHLTPAVARSVRQLHPSELIMVEFPSSKSRITRPAYVNVLESVTEAWDKSEGTLGRSTLVMLSSTKSSAWAFKSKSKEEREKKNDSLLRLLAARRWGDVWIRLGVIEKEQSEEWRMRGRTWVFGSSAEVLLL